MVSKCLPNHRSWTVKFSTLSSFKADPSIANLVVPTSRLRKQVVNLLVNGISRIGPYTTGWLSVYEVG